MINSDGKLIALRFHDLFCITTSEYERIQREIQARRYVADIGICEIIIMQLLKDGAYRYNEILSERARDEVKPLFGEDLDD